jgi:Ni2+-binding GTPase involved in maturation of urease and hydrogenase
MAVADTVTFIHGPQGSGKTSMLDALVQHYKRLVKIPFITICLFTYQTDLCCGLIAQRFTKRTPTLPYFKLWPVKPGTGLYSRS